MVGERFAGNRRTARELKLFGNTVVEGMAVQCVL